MTEDPVIGAAEVGDAEGLRFVVGLEVVGVLGAPVEICTTSNTNNSSNHGTSAFPTLEGLKG